MPNYVYSGKCEHPDFLVVKSASELNREEHCYACDAVAERKLTVPQINVPMHNNDQRFTGRRLPK